MPRRSIPSAAERASLLLPPDTEEELIRHYSFGETDLSLIRQRRGDANRLGVAVQLCLLRFPGQGLQPNASIPMSLLQWIGRGQVASEEPRPISTSRQPFLPRRVTSMPLWRISTQLRSGRGRGPGRRFLSGGARRHNRAAASPDRVGHSVPRSSVSSMAKTSSGSTASFVPIRRRPQSGYSVEFHRLSAPGSAL